MRHAAVCSIFTTLSSRHHHLLHCNSRVENEQALCVAVHPCLPHPHTRIAAHLPGRHQKPQSPLNEFTVTQSHKPVTLHSPTLLCAGHLLHPYAPFHIQTPAISPPSITALRTAEWPGPGGKRNKTRGGNNKSSPDGDMQQHVFCSGLGLQHAKHQIEEQTAAGDDATHSFAAALYVAPTT